MKNYSIAVIPGDGTGPEVTRENIKVIKVVGEKYGIEFDLDEFNWGAKNYLKTGVVLPDNAEEKLKEHDAIFLGAIGHPDVEPGILEKGIILRLRFGLDQYINLRPAILYDEKFCPLKDKGPEDIDFVVVRENCGGLYKGLGEIVNKGKPDEKATQVMEYTRPEVDRALRFAFDYTQNQRGERPWKGLEEKDLDNELVGQLTLCGKTNVLTNVYDLWNRRFNEIGEEEFPNVKRNYMHVDATCMWMVKNPEYFDVIVTGNMFGDIITDLAAEVQGGMGIAAGGNLNPEGVSMFEPIGGSAPKYEGMNVINPLAAIESGRMMLDHLGEKEAAKSIEGAVRYVCTQMKSLSAKKMGYSTTEVGDMVAKHVLEN